MSQAKTPRKRVAPTAVRKGPLRQRQRLIEACISALHIYGPSRTTVGKVVSFAKMSPGIVRFYFDSKAAMLVASLQYLAAEFEKEVLIPVGKIKSTPVAALELMVDAFLDADLASPRKVSAWYTFWGEASSRQEYYDICGQKDESFALLVHELVAALIVDTRQPHLDADAIALGLIGVLEVLWQDIAFQTESDIDRAAAKRRCMAYLSSIFPSRFGPAPAVQRTQPALFDSSVYADPLLFSQERELLFSDAWTVVGHESQLPHPGEYLALDIGNERVLVVRDASGGIHALRNNCPVMPHVLQTGRQGRFASSIDCKVHDVSFSLQGQRLEDAGRGGLAPLDLHSVNGLLFVRSRRASGGMGARPHVGTDSEPPAGLMMLRAPLEITVMADWKVMVEQWLETVLPDVASLERGSLAGHAPLAGGGWSAARYRRLMECLPSRGWRREFMAPHQLFENRPDGYSVIQAWPTAAGRCVVRRLDYSLLPPNDGARATIYLAQRVGGHARRSVIGMAESVQTGMIEFGYAAAAGRPVAPAIAWFRDYLASRLPSLTPERAPNVP